MTDPTADTQGRVLVVGPTLGDDPAVRRRDAMHAADIFQALGAVTVAGPRAPIDLVILEDGAVPAPAQRAADAIRRIDPSLLVALAIDPAVNGNGTTGEGFDAVLEMPLEPARLAELVGDTAVASEPETAETPETPVEPERSKHEPEAVIPEPAPVLETPAAPEPRGETPVHEFPPGLVDHPAELGDVDLVDAILAEESGLTGMAVALVMQQTGWDDLRLESETPADEAVASAVVSHGDHRYGWLCSSQASAATLRPWGAWLGRWLALEGRVQHYRLLAQRDDLTGAWNRRFFNRFIEDSIRRARELRRPISVMVFDIDDFKRYNDLFGHQAGDVVLIETVRLLNSVIRRGDRVCRIGGDEFAVIFADLEAPRSAGSTHPAAPELIATRFQDQICRMRFPKLGSEAPGPLSISAGLATFPWDGTTPEELLKCADSRALKSKRKGKNALTLGPDAASRKCDD